MSGELPITRLEQEWDKEDVHIFRSEKHNVMAIASRFPKLPLEVVIAPRYGVPGGRANFIELEPVMRRKLHELSDIMELMMYGHTNPDQRVVTHIEGFGLPDHAHIVKFIAERRQGEALYNGQQLGELAVRNTVETLAFEKRDIRMAERRLDAIG